MEQAATSNFKQILFPNLFRQSFRKNLNPGENNISRLQELQILPAHQLCKPGNIKHVE
jgi:hypothetical protein